MKSCLWYVRSVTVAAMPPISSSPKSRKSGTRRIAGTSIIAAQGQRTSPKSAPEAALTLLGL